MTSPSLRDPGYEALGGYWAAYEREALGGYWAALWDPAPEGEQCSVKGCAQAAAYELVVRERTLLFWLCCEHWAQGVACLGPGAQQGEEATIG